MVETEKGNRKYILTLYVSGVNPRTRFAVENIRKICKEHLKGRYELEIVDIREDPSVAVHERIVATPVLIKRLPQPIRTFIGNLQDTEKILVGLELKEQGEDE